MKQSINIATRVLCCFIPASCSRNAEDELRPPETIPEATIQFFSPLPDTSYARGNSIDIKARAISTAAIHGYDLAILNAIDLTNIYFTHIHNHNDTLHINEQWKSTVSTPSQLEAEITLYLDHDGHTKKEKVSFRVQ